MEINYNSENRIVNKIKREKVINMARPKGSGNVPLKRLLAERLATKYPDFDPIIAMIDSCVEIQRAALQSGEAADHRGAVEALDRVAKYVQPQLKSVDHQVSSLTVSVNRKRFDTTVNDNHSQTNDLDSSI